MSKSHFLKGMGSVINLFPQDRNINLPLPNHSDEEAFKKDLEQVGADMRFAMKSLDQKYNIRNDDNDMERISKF